MSGKLSPREVRRLTRSYRQMLRRQRRTNGPQMSPTSDRAKPSLFEGRGNTPNGEPKT